MSKLNLKPCPFCGGSFRIIIFSRTEKGLRHYIPDIPFDSRCPVRGITYYSSVRKAIQACNRRIK